MTIDEARVWLQRHADKTPMPGAREAYKTILVALERTRWIPVTEELPEKQCMVLMRYNNGDMYVGCVKAVHGDLAVWYARNVNCPGLAYVCDPAFWMPLPEPPGVE